MKVYAHTICFRLHKIRTWALTFLTFALLLNAPNALLAARDNLLRFDISWESPVRLAANESDHLDLIYFEGGIYEAKYPTLPVFSHRLPAVPHHYHRAVIRDVVFIPVGPEEDAILRNSGYREENLTMDIDLQYIRKQKLALVSFYPIRYNAGADVFEKVASFALQVDWHFDAAFSRSGKKEIAFPAESMLASGDWFKVCVEETGVYRLGFDDLEELGMSPAAIEKSNIRLFGHGGGMLPEANSQNAYSDMQENAIWVSGALQGSFGQEDQILFYGEGPDQWHYDQELELFRHQPHLYATKSCYFITSDHGQGLRIESRKSLEDAPSHEVDIFTHLAVHRRELANLIGSGQMWFGEVFDATSSRGFSFEVPNIVQNQKAVVYMEVAARSTVPSAFSLREGSSQKAFSVPSINPADYNGFHARAVSDTMHFTPSVSNGVQFSLSYNRPASGSRGWLSHIVLNAPRRLVFAAPQMGFREPRLVGEGHLLRYMMGNASQQVRVWDVTHAAHVREQVLERSGNNAAFTIAGDQLREFVAFDGSDFLSPVLKGKLPNQNLHALQGADMVIVVPGAWKEEALRLADFREAMSGLTVQVVTTDAVYNEFSSGMPDPTAIRNFMRMLYERAETPDDIPRYLLLFGSGSIDHKNRLGYGKSFIPTYQSRASLSYRESYMTDDYFGLLDPQEGQDAFGVVDIGIGRLPVRNQQEASMLVDKIIRYEERVDGFNPFNTDLSQPGMVSNYADWRNAVVFIADDGDYNTHLNHAEILSGRLHNNHPQYHVEKIYLDAYEQIVMAGGARYPDVNRAINARVNKGALLINYIGHGGTRGLADQRILTMADISTWNNIYNMPVFMTATCQFSSFDQADPDDLSAGVSIVLKPSGGTVALYTTTRLAWSGSNLVLNSHFMDAAFELNDHGERHRLGDLIRIAKERSSGASTPMQLRNFVYLGDPSMGMAHPRYRVVTESIPDTIKAFQEVEISGYITDALGVRMDNYSGIVYPTVYDKATQFTTLGNNPASIPTDFSMYEAVLYRGKVSVKDGRFDFRFTVPRDIAYSFGPGKVSYYLDNGHVDGNGAFAGFVVGGSQDEFEPDYDGPLIQMYMNDTTFVSGEQTTPNPILIALLSDENGINLTGRIGHDIVSFFQSNPSQQFRLNTHYEADLDNATSGRVVYPFHNLEEGPHTLTLRAWDIHNNPSEASIDFVVSDSGKLLLGNLMNFPNPFSNETWFRFEYNEQLDVRIDVFDIKGARVHSTSRRLHAAGLSTATIHWDGNNHSGHFVGNGVFVYRVLIQSPDGRESVQSERLVIMR